MDGSCLEPSRAEMLQRENAKLRTQRDFACAVLSRLATHENLDELDDGSPFGVDREAIEWVRHGLVEAGYLAPRKVKP